MDKYLQQLLQDISISALHADFPGEKGMFSLADFVAEEDEERLAPVLNLEEWTGIKQDALPPSSILNDEQVKLLLSALINLLDMYNCCFITQITVPERIQYETIRNNFRQEVKVKTWHTGFFDYCKPGTTYDECVMQEYCHCKFFRELFGSFKKECLSPQEERARSLENEVNYIKIKYGDDWMKYYPYHLDPEYDDNSGNPYDYGFGDCKEEPDW